MLGGRPPGSRPRGGAMPGAALRISSGATALRPALQRAGAATGSAGPSWLTGCALSASSPC